MDPEKKDVQEVVAPAKEGETVEVKPTSDDKDKNFAELRKQLKEKEDEIARLKADKEPDRSLETKDAKEEKETKKVDPLKAVFERDLKEATIQWNTGKNVSNEDWAAIKGKVSLNGDETISEIKAKIDEAYNSLPHVREKREKDLIEKGKREAMQQFQDDELDIGGGGEADLGGETEPRFTTKEKGWLNAFGVKPEERKAIKRDADTNEWQIGKSPTRKFFQP
jgi:hypothetical protein